MMRRLTALLLVAMFAATATAAVGGGFTDTTTHWARGEVEALAALDITRGCNPPANDRFCPDAPVTRGEVAVMICRALDACEPTVTPATTTVPAEPWVDLHGTDRYIAMVEHYFHPDHWAWAKRVAACESEWNPTAKNPNSSASGIFQFISSTWASASTAAGWSGADVFDPEANIAVAAYWHEHVGPSQWECK